MPHRRAPGAPVKKEYRHPTYYPHQSHIKSNPYQQTFKRLTDKHVDEYMNNLRIDKEKRKRGTPHKRKNKSVKFSESTKKRGGTKKNKNV